MSNCPLWPTLVRGLATVVLSLRPNLTIALLYLDMSLVPFGHQDESSTTRLYWCCPWCHDIVRLILARCYMVRKRHMRDQYDAENVRLVEAAQIPSMVCMPRRSARLRKNMFRFLLRTLPSAFLKTRPIGNTCFLIFGHALNLSNRIRSAL